MDKQGDAVTRSTLTMHRMMMIRHATRSPAGTYRADLDVDPHLRVILQIHRHRNYAQSVSAEIVSGLPAMAEGERDQILQALRLPDGILNGDSHRVRHVTVWSEDLQASAVLVALGMWFLRMLVGLAQVLELEVMLTDGLPGDDAALGHVGAPLDDQRGV